MARELDSILAWHGKPTAIVSDNGTGLTSSAVISWTDKNGTAYRKSELNYQKIASDRHSSRDDYLKTERAVFRPPLMLAPLLKRQPDY